jgi:hypothetical protein
MGLLALCAALASVPALASDNCEAPIARWQSREAALNMAARQGWQVQRLKIDDGCYEIHGIDAQGRKFKAKVDPETLQVVKLKRREHRGDGKAEHERERKHERDPGARGGAPAQDAQTPQPLFAPGTSPRGQIE